MKKTNLFAMLFTAAVIYTDNKPTPGCFRWSGLALTLLMLFGSISLKSQTLDSIAHHYVGSYGVDMRNMMELRDGNILANCQLFLGDEEGLYLGDLGNRMLKLSPEDLSFLDSVLVENDDLNLFLMERNPFGDDNIFAWAERDLENNHTDLRICFFDDDLVFYPEKELRVPLCDGVFPPLKDAYCIDPQGNIAVAFKMTSAGEYHLYRVGLDGNIISKAVYSLDSIPFTWDPGRNNLGIFNEDPLEFCLWGSKPSAWDQPIHLVIFDEQLNLKETFVPGGEPVGISYDAGNGEMVVDGDDGTFLLTSRWDGTALGSDGVRVTRYDKSTHEALQATYFNTKPAIVIGNSCWGCAFPIGMVQADNGDVYFAYATQDRAAPIWVGQVAVVRMDHDLNVIWERFCLEATGYTREATETVLMENGLFAVGGYVLGAPPQLFFLFLDNNGVGVEEGAELFRPYSFYPNPVSDALYLHYSPDVKPESVAILDMQGRQLVSQRSGLDRIDVSGLAPGIYSLCVTLSDGKCYTDNLVKE